jgi:putative ABC transport system permease protein
MLLRAFRRAPALFALIVFTSRQAEFALMGALGATRLRLVGHAMAESLALAALGGLGGLAVARLLLVMLLDRLPPQMAMLATMTTLNWRAIAVATGLSMVTCLAVGVLPALRVARIDVIEGLKGRPSGGTDRASERWQSALVIGQLALVLVLLTGTGLLLRSFVRLVGVEPGFDPSGLLVFDIQLPTDRYQAPGASLAFFEELERRVEAVPGVTSATFSQGAPPTGGAFSFDIQPEAEGRPGVAAPGLNLPNANVAPDYFVTLGIPLLAGRTFAPEDPEEVVIVNDVLARRFWGESSPVGRRFRLDPQRPWLTVVGVARDVKQMGLNDPMGDGMEVYFPYPRTTGARFFAFIVRTRGNQAGVAQQVKERMWTLDPTVPVIAALTMDERLVESVARPRFLVGLSSAFAGMALLLAGVGVYGTAAYWVARRRRELGVRLALGATRRAIVSLVIGRSVRLAAWGCAIGVAVSLMVTTILGSLLFQTSPREPAIFAAVIALQVGLVVTACYLPALRASRVDPAVVLRTE